MKPHHIGYLVKNIEKALPEFLALGYDCVSSIIYDQYRNIDICFLQNGELCVELVCPKSGESVVSGLLKKIGVSPYHICYIVEDIDKTAETLRAWHYIPMGEVMPAPALHNSPAAFFYHRQLGILELITHE